MCSIVNMATLPSPSSSVDVHASTSPGLPPSPYSAQLSPSFPSNSSSNVYLPTVQSPPPLSPASSSFGPLQNTRRTSKDADTPEIVYRDTNFTVYRERNSPVSSRGHLVFVFKYAFFLMIELYILTVLSIPWPPLIVIRHRQSTRSISLHACASYISLRVMEIH